MPKIFRFMRNENGRPELGPSGTTMGVRTTSGQPIDIAVDVNQNVAPGTGGMSVALNLKGFCDCRRV